MSLISLRRAVVIKIIETVESVDEGFHPGCDIIIVSGRYEYQPPGIQVCPNKAVTSRLSTPYKFDEFVKSHFNDWMPAFAGRTGTICI